MKSKLSYSPSLINFQQIHFRKDTTLQYVKKDLLLKKKTKNLFSCSLLYLLGLHLLIKRHRFQVHCSMPHHLYSIALCVCHPRSRTIGWWLPERRKMGQTAKGVKYMVTKVFFKMIKCYHPSKLLSFFTLILCPFQPYYQ